jgi:RNA polymerase sigma-70 factor (ECF subfamily)
MTPTTVDWSMFYHQLQGFVAARVRSAADADDLVQLILERAMEKVGSAEIENVAGWLFGIARHAIADHYRGQARTLLAAAEQLEGTPDAVGTSASFGSEEERAHVIACMGPLLDTMAADDAQLLRWADMEDRSMQSIADALGISLTATKSRVQRARKEFIKVTRECCAITKDARGRVTDLTPHPIPNALECAAAAGCSMDSSRTRGSCK